MSRVFFLPIIFLSSLFLFSCEEDFEVNADEKEVPVIYGLLDKNDPNNYLRISKAFLNENTSALRLAKDASVSDIAEDIDVKIIELNLGIRKEYRFIPDRSIVTDKEEGVFYAPQELVYRLDENGLGADNFLHVNEPGISQDRWYLANDKVRYFIEVTSKKTGLTYSARTNMVLDASNPQPQPFDKEFTAQQNINQFVNGCDRFEPSSNLGLRSAMSIGFRSGSAARVYDALYVLHYTEYDSAAKTSLAKEVSMNILKRYRLSSLRANQEVLTTFNPETFYRAISLELQTRPEGIARYADSLELRIVGGGQDIYDYMSVNDPSLGIVEKQTTYTNLSNGAEGIFSSRNTVSYYYYFGRCDLYELQNGELTGNLGFTDR